MLEIQEKMCWEGVGGCLCIDGYVGSFRDGLTVHMHECLVS